MTFPPCAFSDHENDSHLQTVACRGPSLFTAHDFRHCKQVCIAHAVWLARHSFLQGHSANCPGCPR